MASLLSTGRLVRMASNRIRATGTGRGRCLASAAVNTDYVSVTLDPDFDGSVAIVTLQKKPVNALCAEQMKGITKAILDLEKDDKVRAMIITSAYSGVFSGGLDIMSMYKKTAEEIYQFWGLIQDMIITNFDSSLFTVAAMNGHCIAGGCAITFPSDYRIMAEDRLIGLHEAKMNLPVPTYMSIIAKNLMGYRTAENTFQLARLLKSEEALKFGLIDEVVPLDEVMTAAKKEVAKRLEIPDQGRIRVKREFRKKETKEFHEIRHEDAELFSTLNSSPEIQDFF